MDNKQKKYDIEEMKNRIENTNMQIELANEKIKTYDNFQNEISFLSKDIDDCVSLLRKSMKGDKVDLVFNNINESNSINSRRIINEVNDNITYTKVQLNEYTKMRDNLEEEYRRENNSQN